MHGLFVTSKQYRDYKYRLRLAIVTVKYTVGTA